MFAEPPPSGQRAKHILVVEDYSRARDYFDYACREQASRDTIDVATLVETRAFLNSPHAPSVEQVLRHMEFEVTHAATVADAIAIMGNAFRKARVFDAVVIRNTLPLIDPVSSHGYQAHENPFDPMVIGAMHQALGVAGMKTSRYDPHQWRSPKSIAYSLSSLLRRMERKYEWYLPLIVADFFPLAQFKNSVERLIPLDAIADIDSLHEAFAFLSDEIPVFTVAEDGEKWTGFASLLEPNQTR